MTENDFTLSFHLWAPIQHVYVNMIQVRTDCHTEYTKVHHLNLHGAHPQHVVVSEEIDFNRKSREIRRNTTTVLNVWVLQKDGK